MCMSSLRKCGCPDSQLDSWEDRYGSQLRQKRPHEGTHDLVAGHEQRSGQEDFQPKIFKAQDTTSPLKALGRSFRKHAGATERHLERVTHQSTPTQAKLGHKEHSSNV